MENIRFDLEWRMHKHSGIMVREDGLCYVPTKCKKYPNGHFTYGTDNGYGYLKVKRKGKDYLVHRLVAQAFIPNPDNLPECNHINEKKDDNRVSNIEWCDRKYNNCYGTRTERMVAHTDYKAIVEHTDWNAKVLHTDYKAIAEKNSKKILQINKEGVVIKEWKSATEAGRKGFTQSSINACCLGKRNHHKGFKWCYA